MMVWLLFIIDLMGLFFYTKIGSIISIGDLPTTNIIEPIYNRKTRLGSIPNLVLVFKENQFFLIKIDGQLILSIFILDNIT